MICAPCSKAAHQECEDRDPKTGEMKRDYASCFCQHRKKMGAADRVLRPKLGESVDG